MGTPAAEAGDIYDQLWKLARDHARPAVLDLIAHGVEPNDILVVIAAGGTGLAQDLVMAFTEAVVEVGHDDGPLVAVLHGPDRQRLFGRWPSARRFAAELATNAVMVVVAPAGMTSAAGISMVVVVSEPS